tara:strand:- start:1008 stop:1970 length:963 start_codon:yes stop_codon:yes gene_type:complete
MGKNKKNKKDSGKMISICTPTFNRRPFIPYLIECVRHQTYPMTHIEWIIVDDGTDPIGDLVQHLSFVKYFYISEKMPLGKKRNLMHSYCSGDILVYMDDDDYYPPERVSHAVEMLKQNPEYLIAGSSEMHMFFCGVHKIYQCGPYGDKIATAATFAFRKELLDSTSYCDADGFSEESRFLKGGGGMGVLQLDPLKTILVVSHLQNSLNKEHMLQDPAQFLMSESRFEISDFIKSPILVDFYIYTVGFLLDNYDAGKRENKPQLNLAKLKQREEQIQNNTETRLAQQTDAILNSIPYKQMKEAFLNKIKILQNKLQNTNDI